MARSEDVDEINAYLAARREKQKLGEIPPDPHTAGLFGKLRTALFGVKSQSPLHSENPMSPPPSPQAQEAVRAQIKEIIATQKAKQPQSNVSPSPVLEKQPLPSLEKTPLPVRVAQPDKTPVAVTPKKEPIPSTSPFPTSSRVNTPPRREAPPWVKRSTEWGIPTIAEESHSVPPYENNFSLSEKKTPLPPPPPIETQSVEKKTLPSARVVPPIPNSSTPPLSVEKKVIRDEEHLLISPPAKKIRLPPTVESPAPPAKIEEKKQPIISKPFEEIPPVDNPFAKIPRTWETIPPLSEKTLSAEKTLGARPIEPIAPPQVPKEPNSLTQGTMPLPPAYPAISPDLTKSMPTAQSSAGEEPHSPEAEAVLRRLRKMMDDSSPKTEN